MRTWCTIVLGVLVAALTGAPAFAAYSYESIEPRLEDNGDGSITILLGTNARRDDVPRDAESRGVSFSAPDPVEADVHVSDEIRPPRPTSSVVTGVRVSVDGASDGRPRLRIECGQVGVLTVSCRARAGIPAPVPADVPPAAPADDSPATPIHGDQLAPSTGSANAPHVDAPSASPASPPPPAREALSPREVHPVVASQPPTRAALPEIPAAVLAGLLALPLLAYALYSRIRPGKELDHSLRARIYAAVGSREGVTAAALGEELQAHLTTVLYHLRRLEARGYVRRVPGAGAGFWTLPDRAPDVVRLSAVRVPLARRIEAAVRERPGAGCAQIARSVAAPFDSVYYHLHRLESAGLVRRASGGDGRAHWHPAPSAFE